MNRINFLIPVFIVLLLWPAFTSNVNKTQKAYDNTVEDNLVSIGKNIIVNGGVNKSLIKIGGSLVLNGSVGKDVVCISSRVVLGRDFRINGDLIMIGGTLEGKNGDRIKGDFHHINFSFKKIDTSLTSISLTPGTVSILKSLFLLLSLIISLIIYGIMPKKIVKSEEILDDNILRIGSLGILSLIVFALLFLISVILSFFYIGIPILMILMILIIGLFVFGRTVVYYSIGRRLISKFNLSIFSPAVFILIGVLIYFILDYIPVAGFIILKIFALFEIGIAVGFILKKSLKLKSVTDFIAEYGNKDPD